MLGIIVLVHHPPSSNLQFTATLTMTVSSQGPQASMQDQVMTLIQSWDDALMLVSCALLFHTYCSFLSGVLPLILSLVSY